MGEEMRRKCNEKKKGERGLMGYQRGKLWVGCMNKSNVRAKTVEENLL